MEFPPGSRRRHQDTSTFARRPSARSRSVDIHLVECWVLEGSQLPRTSVMSTVFSTEEIAECLETATQPTPKFKTVAGLRLICIEQEYSIEWPFDEGTVIAIREALGLPASYSHLFLPKSGACGRYLGNHGQPVIISVVACHVGLKNKSLHDQVTDFLSTQPVFIYTRSNNNGAISTVLKYDSATNTTAGYVLLGPRISVDAACAQICSQFPEFPHPLLVPTVLIELTARDLMRELYHINRLLTTSEDKSGTGDWQFRDSLANPAKFSKRGAYLGEPTSGPSWYDESAREMLEEPSYWAEMSLKMANCESNHQLVHILGWFACRFAFMQAAVNCAINMVEFTRKELDAIETYVPATMRHRLKTQQEERNLTNSSGLVHRVEMLESNLRHMAVFGAIEPRMQAQQTMLFNLINIGMARDSKELTEASKRDSSAMKIIAMLTTFFLPGTFIAAFFAMPILDWKSLSMSGVMTDHFWFYWVVAIPLTVVVMTFVVIYGRIQEKRNKKASEEARKEAGFGV